MTDFEVSLGGTSNGKDNGNGNRKSEMRGFFASLRMTT